MDYKYKYEIETGNSIYSGNGQMLPEGSYSDDFVEYLLKQLSIHGVVVRYVSVEKVNEIDQYLNDLDNLIDIGHFSNDSVRDYTFHHKEMGVKQFISKGREFIRQLIMKEKGVIG